MFPLLLVLLLSVVRNYGRETINHRLTLTSRSEGRGLGRGLWGGVRLPRVSPEVQKDYSHSVYFIGGYGVCSGRNGR